MKTKTRKRKKKNDYWEFKKKHPEIDVGLMLDAYQKCPYKKPRVDFGTIKKAYKHIYVTKCGWCLKYIENAKKLEESGVLISKVRDWQVGRY